MGRVSPPALSRRTDWVSLSAGHDAKDPLLRTSPCSWHRRRRQRVRPRERRLRRRRWRSTTCSRMRAIKSRTSGAHAPSAARRSSSAAISSARWASVPPASARAGSGCVSSTTVASGFGGGCAPAASRRRARNRSRVAWVHTPGIRVAKSRRSFRCSVTSPLVHDRSRTLHARTFCRRPNCACGDSLPARSSIGSQTALAGDSARRRLVAVGRSLSIDEVGLSVLLRRHRHRYSAEIATRARMCARPHAAAGNARLH